MNHKTSTIKLAALSVVLATAMSATSASPKPNILLVFTDDVGWGDIGCYNPDGRIPTPNVDKLAAGGMRFTHAHTPAALCAPTRYSMLTGNYPWRGRLPGGTWGFNVPSQIKPGQKAFPQLLKPAGYRCAMFGKAGIGGFWGMTPDATPEHTPAPVEWGFAYSWLIPRGHQAEPLAFFENGVITSPLIKGKAPDWDAAKVGASLLEKAVAFLDDHARNHPDAPFFVHFCTDGAHSPYAPAEALAGQPLRDSTGMTAHTDMVKETDILLGALLAALDRLKLRDNTLVIYTSDNGGLPHERELGHDAVRGLRGEKSTIFEGGHRVPFVANWPGKIPAGTVRHQPIGTHDVVATALELAGLAHPKGQALDSVSLAPILLGRQDDSQPVREFLLTQSSPGRGPTEDNGFRAGRPQPIENPEKNPKGKVTAKVKSGSVAFAIYEGYWKLILDNKGEPCAIYDLARDLAEEHNLLDAEPARAARMARSFREIRQ